jgi:CHAT domain-containing protein
MGDNAKAEPLAATALIRTVRHLEAASVILSERQQLAMNQMLRFRLDYYVSLALNAGQRYQAKAARAALTWKGAILVRQRAMRLAAREPRVTKRFTQLQQITRQLASLSRATPEADQDDWKQRITALTADKERLETELSRDSAAFRSALKVITPELIQASIPNNGVLIDFLQFTWSKPANKKGQWDNTTSLLAIVVKRDGEPKLLDLGPIAPLSESIDTWRETFGMSPQGKQAGTAIRKQIWEPLLEHIGDAKTVLVSTDGVLGRLPLAALPGKQPDSYLLEDHRLAMIPVPQLLPALVNAQGTDELSRELMLMGDVDYDADPSAAPTKKKRKKRRPGKNRSDLVQSDFPALAGAAGEVAAIQVLYNELFEADTDDVQAIKQARASEATFRSLAGQFRHLHLATHGFFASEQFKSALDTDSIASRSQRTRLASGDVDITGLNPGLLSGLAFAGANLEPVPGKDDGILTAQEIAFLPLNNVETVVLSACETGLGKVAGGEGLIGIQRAFQIAGVRTTVASLWKVDDNVTRMLMERFYRNLWDKEMSQLDTLREAQLYILKNPNSIRSSLDVKDIQPKQTSPQFWAAFQMSGDWR